MPEAREHATVNVFGRDRKGVVAEVTSFIFRQGGNIEELVEQVSRNEFHMTLVASWEAGRLERPALTRSLKELGGRLGMDMRARFTAAHARPRMAILASRELHCLDALMRAARGGRLRAEPVLLGGNHRDLARHARRYKLPFVHADFRDRVRSEQRIMDALERAEADVVVLARFMKILSPRFAWRYRNRIINIHPSLLPAFPGAGAYRQAWEHGVKVVGVTSHFVTPELDGGPIICQAALPIRSGEGLDSIVRRGQALEAAVLLKAVKLFLANKLDVHWGRVKDV